jgi:tRNA dimethylallyltransferase
MIEKLNSEICHYAKRQMTWFRKDKNINWVKVEEREKILREVKEFLKN